MGDEGSPNFRSSEIDKDWDCPEIDTGEGKKAKQFVEEVLKGVPSLTVLSSKNPTFDRYEADVFFIPVNFKGSEIGHECYLNNLLLEKGYAVRVRNRP